MNLDKLKRLELDFLHQYPEGFYGEDMKKIAKKHNLSKHVEYIHKVCSEENFKKGIKIFNDVAKVVQKSSMVSVFEKVKYRDMISDFDQHEKAMFLEAVYELIHGNEKSGFNQMIAVLTPYKLAKWPLVTVWRAYYYSAKDVFIKPTTVKKVITYLELEDIKYTPKVNYPFYRKYRTYLNKLKKNVEHKSLKPNNPAFSGFLMVTIK